jgi:hypothetical protein
MYKKNKRETCEADFQSHETKTRTSFTFICVRRIFFSIFFDLCMYASSREPVFRIMLSRQWMHVVNSIYNASRARGNWQYTYGEVHNRNKCMRSRIFIIILIISQILRSKETREIFHIVCMYKTCSLKMFYTNKNRYNVRLVVFISRE